MKLLTGRWSTVAAKKTDKAGGEVDRQKEDVAGSPRPAGTDKYVASTLRVGGPLPGSLTLKQA